MTSNNRTNELNQNETKSGQEFCFSEAQVEAVARAMAEVKSADYKMPVHLITEQVIGAYRPAARAALVAAQEAAPVLPSSTVDEGTLAGSTDYAALIEELREDALDAGHIYEERLLTKAADAIAALVAAAALGLTAGQERGER